MNLRSLLGEVSGRLGIPADVGAGLPRLECSGFRECFVDQNVGILEYSHTRIVAELNAGVLTIEGEDLRIRRMRRDGLNVCGRIRALSFEEAG